MCVCVCVSSSVPKSDSQNGLEAITNSRGVEQPCRAPLNKALYSGLRISVRTLTDVPAYRLQHSWYVAPNIVRLFQA